MINQPNSNRLVDADDVKQLCSDFSSRNGNIYILDVAAALEGLIAHQPKQEPYAYIDDKNRLVKISGHVYFDGGFVDANSEIPDSWKTLVLVEKVGA